MNNKKYTYYLLLLFPTLLLFSCTQDDMPGVAERADGSGIVFRVSLPEAESRSTDMIVGSTLNNGFYVSAICPEDDASAGNALNLYFDEQYAEPMAEMAGYFGAFDPSSELYVWPTNRHTKEGKLRFFAFYPSREMLRQSAGVDSEAGAGGESDYFVLANRSTKLTTGVTYDYRIEKFKINKNIARHIDFVTATVEGSKSGNSETGVRLEFEHQLSRIALTAWGNTPTDIEIAGVRIGHVVTEGDFNFTDKPAKYAQGDNTTTGNWVFTRSKECVEYIFDEGDAVVTIGNGNHNTLSSATSIMGRGGYAMVIPADYNVWKTQDAPNTSKGLYFSVLMRVKEDDVNRTLVYPYPAGTQFTGTTMTDGMTIIYMSIDKGTGRVVKRLYRNSEGEYFTNSDFTEPYYLPNTAEIRNYGWAAIPLNSYFTAPLRWKPGYQYTYTLDYSDGVGVHDPDDPYPGKPIISNILVGVAEGTNKWPIVHGFDSGGETNVTDNITIE